MVEAVLTIVWVLFQDNRSAAKFALTQHPSGASEKREDDQKTQHQVGRVPMGFRAGVTGMGEQGKGGKGEKAVHEFHSVGSFQVDYRTLGDFPAKGKGYFSKDGIFRCRFPSGTDYVIPKSPTDIHSPMGLFFKKLFGQL
jgi:hypothetical protein